jgi:SAM-dependent methyltransferase
MDEAGLEIFYAQEYRELYQGSQGPNAKDLVVQTERAQSLYGFIQEPVNAIKRHLDIGCSAGLLLQQFTKAYGCRPVGVEPGEAYRTYALAQKLPVYASLGDLAANESEQFDFISLAHVLEHLPDPVTYLSALRQEWLAPGGWLLLEVPNLYGHDCFEVAHLVSYSPHTLQQVLQQAGYQIQAQRVHGQPRSQTIPLYITVLAQSAKETASLKIEPESGVQRKRQLAMLRRRVVTRLAPQKAWLPVQDGK